MKSNDSGNTGVGVSAQDLIHLLVRMSKIEERLKRIESMLERAEMHLGKPSGIYGN